MKSSDNSPEAAKPKNVDEYIANCPAAVQKMLESVRATIKNAAPEAIESIGYGMPAYTLNGPLVYFAAFKNHIGFYATPTGHVAFESELSGYKQGKGSVQFPLDQPMPLGLIARITEFRVSQNRQKKIKNRPK